MQKPSQNVKHISNEIIEEINNFVALHLLEDYLPHNQKTPVRSPKIIHSTPWGTHKFEKYEIALIDTPLIQRLRQVQQTAMSYMTFPSSTHSRFEHTLGVTQQSTNLYKSLFSTIQEEKNGNGNEHKFSIECLKRIRIAAILHDCGHGPLSHTSEEIYQFCDDMQALIKPDGPFPKKNPHEVLGYLIVTSSAFKEFWNKIDRIYNIPIDIDWIAQTIIGNCEYPERRYETQIINGPFDADKIDYIFRDGVFIGLPLSIDLERLWNSILVSIRDLGDGKWERILTMSFSGSTPLEQILFCKFVLFETIYHHQKVRAVDCMFKGIIEYIVDNIDSIDLGDAKNITFKKATDFLWFTDDMIFSLAYTIDDPTLHRLIHNILYRRLLKRALVICKESIKEETLSSYTDIRKLSRKGDIIRGRKKRELAVEIWNEAKKPCELYEVWLDIPAAPTGKEGDFAFIRYPKMKSDKDYTEYELRKLSKSFPTETWATMYTEHKWRGHVFAPNHCLSEISKAAKNVLESEFGVEFNDLAQTLCHINPT